MPQYDRIVRDMQKKYEIKVKRWRKTMSGKAWRVTYEDGRVMNWVESPKPRTPISLAIFLHEVGHHAIGFETYKKRCEEEFHVWIWAVDEMRRLGIEPDERVNKRVELSLQYAVAKAVRRGIKNLPDSLLQYSKAA